MARRSGRGGTRPGGEPQAPSGPRRPAASATSPGRPSSLVNKTKESTQELPDLRLRIDDVERGFLYAPQFGEPTIPPIPCTGPRSTKRLSPRALRQIKGAAAKANQLGIKLTTFITFTVAPQFRPLVDSGDIVLGRELKRTLNGLNEWLRRRERDSLAYIWVAENARNENPHVHMLTSYTVPRTEFDDFAVHLESLWGLGWAKIERVRSPQKAGRYLMKALSYTLKGADDDQGIVVGNRYGISRSIMPVYETVDLFHCEDAATGLRLLQACMVDENVQLEEGIWLTRHGMAFEAGTDFGEIRGVLETLAEGRPQEP